VAFGIGLGCVALAPTLPTAYLAAGVMGAMASMFLSATGGSLHLMTDDPFRGRVMALYTVGFLGTAPAGGPAMGYLAQVLNPRASMLLGAAASAVAALFGSRSAKRL
jgi:MFS family permease